MKTCCVCGNPFKSPRGNFKTCSPECSWKRELERKRPYTLASYHRRKNDPDVIAYRKQLEADLRAYPKRKRVNFASPPNVD